MKNKIMLIVIVILSIISITSIGIIIYQSKNYVKIPKQYKCETKVEETEKMKQQRIIILNINQEQYIESYQNKTISTYIDERVYDFVKQSENQEGATYTFNDDDKTVLTDFEAKKVVDSDNNTVDIWYKDYIKKLESSGYTCNISK